MENLRNYRKKLIKLFIISINKDMKNWKKKWEDVYTSISYNKVVFMINIKKKCLYFVDENSSNTSILLSRFAFHKIPLNFKIWYYYMKLKHNFDAIDKENKKKRNNQVYNEKVIDFKKAFNNAQESFKKELRKEKLNKLS